ncbi:hypothetical protein B0H14DRAFT_2659493, partial [Mycena olivaceomarginata]
SSSASPSSAKHAVKRGSVRDEIRDVVVVVVAAVGIFTILLLLGCRERLEGSILAIRLSVCAKHRTRLILLKELAARADILVFCVSLDVALSPSEASLRATREVTITLSDWAKNWSEFRPKNRRFTGAGRRVLRVELSCNPYPYPAYPGYKPAGDPHTVTNLSVTRKEQTFSGDPITEIEEPVMADDCDHVCANCEAQLRKNIRPLHSHANHIWVGKVPWQLKDSSYAEKNVGCQGLSQ